MYSHESRALAALSVLLVLAAWAAIGVGLFLLPVDMAVASELEAGGRFGVTLATTVPYALGSVLLLVWAPFALKQVVPAAMTALLAALVAAWIGWLAVFEDLVADLRPGLTTWLGAAAILCTAAVIVSVISLVRGQATLHATWREQAAQGGPATHP